MAASDPGRHLSPRQSPRPGRGAGSPRTCRTPRRAGLLTYLHTYLFAGRKCVLIDFNNNNNKQIAPYSHSFRGAGARQRVSEQRKNRKPGKEECLWPRLKNTVTKSSLLRTVFGSEF